MLNINFYLDFSIECVATTQSLTLIFVVFLIQILVSNYHRLQTLRQSKKSFGKIIIKIKGLSLSGYCLADNNKTFSCVVIKDKNTFAGMMSALCAYIDVVCRNVPVMQACR